MYLVYRRDRSSDTYHLKDLEDMVIKTLRVDVSMFIYCLITGVITEYKTEIWGGNQNFHNVIPRFFILDNVIYGNIL